MVKICQLFQYTSSAMRQKTRSLEYFSTSIRFHALSFPKMIADAKGLRISDIVTTENSVRSENTEVPIIREIMVATTMSSLFVALFALVASSFRTRAALQAEILANGGGTWMLMNCPTDIFWQIVTASAVSTSNIGMSFRANRIVAASKIACFRSSVMESPQFRIEMR